MPGEILQYLPAIYQAADEHSLLSHLLAAFENVLLKRSHGNSGEAAAVEELVADLARYFDPKRAPSDFLPWLAGWAAMTLRADLTESRQRDIIARIIPLYGKRGTRRGISEMVELFTGGTVEIEEPADPEFQIGDHSTIGRDTYLGGPPPHMFQVIFSPPEDHSYQGKEYVQRMQLDIEIARSVIDMAKPAHTWYTFEIGTRENAQEPVKLPEEDPARHWGSK
jgi:phage tail-like protein